jgi:hypothetical protein
MGWTVQLGGLLWLKAEKPHADVDTSFWLTIRYKRNARKTWQAPPRHGISASPKAKLLICPLKFPFCG